ncbi:hypothetical protein E1J02_17705 [Phocaeicola dorei]|nr:hypothetical protein E1J02_17705 [Phocaeicola dorei]
MSTGSCCILAMGECYRKNSLIRKPEKHRIFNEKKGELTEENISITVDYTEEYDALFLSVRFLCKSSGDLTIGFTDTQGDYALKTKHIDQSEEWQEYELSGKWAGIGDFYLSFTGLIIVDILRLADKAYDDHREEFRTYQSQTKQNLELMVSAINELKRMKSEYDKKIEEISKSLIEIRGEIPDVSGLETSLSELEKTCVPHWKKPVPEMAHSPIFWDRHRINSSPWVSCPSVLFLNVRHHANPLCHR